MNKFLYTGIDDREDSLEVPVFLIYFIQKATSAKATDFHTIIWQF